MIGPSNSSPLYYLVAYSESKITKKRTSDLKYRHSSRGRERRKEWDQSPEGRYSKMRRNLRYSIKRKTMRIAELERML